MGRRRRNELEEPVQMKKFSSKETENGLTQSKRAKRGLVTGKQMPGRSSVHAEKSGPEHKKLAHKKKLIPPGKRMVSSRTANTGSSKSAKQGSEKRRRTGSSPNDCNDMDSEKILDSLLEELKDMSGYESEEEGHETSNCDVKEIVDAIHDVERAEEELDSSLGGSSNAEDDISVENYHDEEERNRKDCAGLNATSGDYSDDDVEDSDSGLGNLSKHKQDLENLKSTDPSFYKYLQENDADLLDIDDDSEDAEGRTDDDNENFLKNDIVEDIDDRIAGDSDSDEDGSLAEAEAAAEAGIDTDNADASMSDTEEESGGENDSKKRRRVIDMESLTILEKQLELNRGSVKAMKELMRIFRAGRLLSDVAQKKALTKADLTSSGRESRGRRRRNEDPDADPDSIFTDDEDQAESALTAKSDQILAGDIKFATARVYQKAMYLSIVQVQESLDKVLGKPKKERTSESSRWIPREHKRWKNLESLFNSFVTQMIALVSGMRDAGTLRFLLKRLERLVPYMRKDVRLARRVLKVAIGIWSAGDRDVDSASKLRAYLLLRAVADERDKVELVLRAVYNIYVNDTARVCNPRTLENILFQAKCIVDLFGVEMSASYTVAFSHLREMAITLRSVLTAKEEKTEVDKVHSWSFVNALRLWSMVLSTYGSEAELRPLIYPYVQISIGVMRVQPTPRTYPLRLHIASFMTNIVGKTGIYIPVAAYLLPLLRCSELKRIPARGSTKQLEWRALLRVSDEVVKTKPFLTGLLNGIVLQLAGFYAVISKHVSYPEISLEGTAVLRKISKEVKVAEWRSAISTLAVKLRENATLVANARARAEFGPQGALSDEGMLACVPGLDKEKKTPVQRFYEVELDRVKRDESLRDHDPRASSGNQANSI